MAEFENLWGQSYDDYSGGFELGVNKDVVLFDIKPEDGNYGLQLYVEFHKGSSATRRWYPVPNADDVTSGRITSDRYKELVTRFNTILKHIVCNYVTEEQYQAHLKSYGSAKEFIVDVLKLIPDNFNEMKGELILGYNKKGYLEVPVSMKITGPFFSVGGKFNLVPSKIIMDSAGDKPRDTDTSLSSPESNDNLPF